MLLIVAKKSRLIYSIRSYGPQHKGNHIRDIKFSIPSKYSNMFISDVAYTNDTAYILFENGHIISHRFGIKCVAQCKNGTFCFSTKGHSACVKSSRIPKTYSSKKIQYNCPSSAKACLNGGTCVLINNITHCWCMIHYYGSTCEFMSNFSLTLKANFNIS